jgi:endonuclease YncB( thermonuclease family)
MERREHKKTLLTTILLLLLSSPAYPWTGKVVSVTDGDTIKVMHQGKAEKIRLYGIEFRF